MINYKRCEKCCGKKEINSIGGFKKKCDECEGMGWIKPIDEDKIVTKRRSGRPRRGE